MYCKSSGVYTVVMMVSRLLLSIGGFHLLLDWSLRLAVLLKGTGPFCDCVCVIPEMIFQT